MSCLNIWGKTLLLLPFECTKSMLENYVSCLKLYHMYIPLVCPTQGQMLNVYQRSDRGWTSKELRWSAATSVPPNAGLLVPILNTCLVSDRPNKTDSLGLGDDLCGNLSQDHHFCRLISKAHNKIHFGCYKHTLCC